MKQYCLLVCLFCIGCIYAGKAQMDTTDRPLIKGILKTKFFLATTERKIEKLDSLLAEFPDTGEGKVGEQYDALRGEIAMSYLKVGNATDAANWHKRIRTNEGNTKYRLNAGSYLLEQNEQGNAAPVEASLQPLVDSVSKAFKKDNRFLDAYNRLMPTYIRALLAQGKHQQIVTHLQPLYAANGQKFPSDARIKSLMKPELYKITYNLSYTYGISLAATKRSKEAIDVLARLYLTGEEVSATIQTNIKDATNKIPGGTAYFKKITDSVRNYYQQKLVAFAANKKDMQGNTVDFKTLKGRYVLLDFWGSWCRPCRASHPHLKELYAKYKNKGFEIVGIATEHAKTAEERNKLWITAVSEDGLTWLQVLNNVNAEKFDVVKEYGVTAFPTKILLDRDGNIIGRYVGNGNGGEAFTTRLEELLGK